MPNAFYWSDRSLYFIFSNCHFAVVCVRFCRSSHVQLLNWLLCMRYNSYPYKREKLPYWLETNADKCLKARDRVERESEGEREIVGNHAISYNLYTSFSYVFFLKIVFEFSLGVLHICFPFNRLFCFVQNFHVHIQLLIYLTVEFQT